MTPPYTHYFVHEGISVQVIYYHPLGYCYSVFRWRDTSYLYSSVNDDKFYPDMVCAKAAAIYYVEAKVNVPL